MNKRIFAACLLAFILFLASPVVSDSGTLSEDVRDHLTHTVGTEAVSERGSRVGMPAVSHLVLEFYEARKFQPAWSDDYGLSPIAFDLLSVVRAARQEGLNPDDYNPGRIEEMLAGFYKDRNGTGAFDAAKLAELDLMLTETFFLYASHIHEGRVDHEKVYPDWVVGAKNADLPEILSEAALSQDIQKAIADLAPPYPGYAALRNELIAYQAVAEKGGWPWVPPGAKIMKGSRGKRVAALRQRLTA
ncbi:MAG TPA: hypothetical protein VLZ07_10585, partial [Syntrophales bacterium]|nr:hypothetical protein [Syntrophales bacterium]